MNIKLKVIAAAAALAFAGAANAKVDDNNVAPALKPKGSEMWLTVFSQSANGGAGLSYSRDLGIYGARDFAPAGTTAPLDSVAGNGVDFAFNPSAVPAVGAGNVLTNGYKLVFGADTALSGLLSFSDAVWSVTGYRLGGGGNLIFTTSNGANVTAASSQVDTAASNAQTYLVGVNLKQPLNNATNGSNTYLPTDTGYAGVGGWGNNWGFGVSNFGNQASVGTSQSFYELFGGGTAAPGTTAAYTNASWTLNGDGTLVYAVTAAVPEPGTWAMLIAGLMMVGGIARRRLQG